MAFWCYILRCADGKYYTGHTDDLERRIAEHHHGGFCDFTSKRRPVQLIWAQDFPTRYEALDCELKVKKWSRAKKEALAAQDWDRLSYLARPPRERVSTSLDTNGSKGVEIGSEDLEIGSGDLEIEDNSPLPVRVERSRDTLEPSGEA